ncbi:helix-turn-helix transcriptional regulator [Leucobacter komagatae]|uniref:HTH luxR-type domain-containing protein n=1 Tax=Leucobacter komagatae TaxID=55969 RepID=A0A0D0IK15_9MICO|nr:LuxR C-terminal-related transcriptional regulator [Leucobacter komagatae]KIP51954.1 hypothetical protein SD72_11995 [Leucobacter komagatae]
MADSIGALHRADDRELVTSSLRPMATRALVDVLFGGIFDGNELVVSDQIGGRTRSVLGQRVRLGDGLGGKAMQCGRPQGVSDYLKAPSITHVFDDVIRVEGLRTMAAVPVLVDGQARGALYAATRDRYHLGNAILGEVYQAATSIGYEMHVRDEVDRRVAILRFAEVGAIGRDRRLTETVRETYAELVSIARLTDDAKVAARLRDFTATLQPPEQPESSTTFPKLSRRQLDVLSQVALGCEYAEVGARLGLKLATVRSYMRAIMVKLSVHSRVEAVSVARAHGLLP